MTTRRLGTVTREDEIPIHYTDFMTGNILSFTWYVNDRDQRVKNKYIYVEKTKQGNIVRSGMLHGLQAVDDMRNDAIRAGWKFWLPPPIDIVGKDAHMFKRKDKRAIEKALKKKEKKKVPVKRGGETFEEFKERVRK